MADFSVQFVLDRVGAVSAIRLTDASVGTFSWGIFTINYPQGIVHKNEDSSSPDISTLGGTVDYPLEVDANGEILKGTYTIQYTALINGFTKIETKIFDFSWIEPTMDITDDSDVTLPEVKFTDNVSYGDGSYTNVAVRSFTCGFPSTSDLSAEPDQSTTDLTLDMQIANEYYEGVYNPALQMTVDYTHISFAYLTIYWRRSYTEEITIKKMKTHFDLIDLVNTFKDNIDAYRGTNTVQFKKEAQNYEQAISLYMHLLQRISLGRADGSQGILEQILEFVEPNSGSYTFQSGPISGSIATLIAGQIFTEGLTTNTIPLASGSEALADSNISQGASDGIIDISTDLRIAGQLISEIQQDAVAAMLQDATGITWTYDDVAGTLTPTVDVGAAGAELLVNKGQANGYAGLDASGKIPSTQLPNAIMTYKGSFDPTSSDESELDVSGRTTTPTGLTFSDDGTKLYVCATSSNGEIIEYTLSDPWNVSSASFVQTEVIGGSNFINSIFINSDGTKVFTTDTATHLVRRYTLSTPYDISTATQDQTYSVNAQEPSPLGISFNPDGSEMFIVGSSAFIIKYSLTTPFTISSGVNWVISKNISGDEANPKGIAFSPSGTKMYVAGTSNHVQEYTLSSAWDINTAGSAVDVNLNTGGILFSDVYLKADGTQMMMTSNTGASDKVLSYDMSVAYDASTLTLSMGGLVNLLNGSGNNDPEDIGDVYRVIAAGSYDFGAGSISFSIGDYVILNESYVWEKSDTTDAVASVFGRFGVVEAQAGDYEASEITNTPYLSITAITVQSAINQLEDFINSALSTLSTLSSTVSGLVTGVSSVFGRTGAVTQQTGDYTASQITSTAVGSISSTNVQSAIAELEAEINAIPSPGLSGSVESWTSVNGSYLNQFNDAENTVGLRYRKITLGSATYIHLQGGCENGGFGNHNNDVIFTLPSGYRPAYNYRSNVAGFQGESPYVLIVQTNGSVYCSEYTGLPGVINQSDEMFFDNWIPTD